MEFRAGEHDHSDHIVHIAEAEGSRDDEFDLIVDVLGAGVGEPEPGATIAVKWRLIFLRSSRNTGIRHSWAQAIHLERAPAISSGPDADFP